MRRINVFGRKGQNIAEYAIVITLVIAAAIAMQTYVKRGIQGRVYDASNKFYEKVSTDTNWSDIGGGSAIALTEKKGQFEPDKLSSQTTKEKLDGSYEQTDMAQGGTINRQSKEVTKQAEGDYKKYDY